MPRLWWGPGRRTPRSVRAGLDRGPRSEPLALPRHDRAAGGGGSGLAGRGDDAAGRRGPRRDAGPLQAGIPGSHRLHDRDQRPRRPQGGGPPRCRRFQRECGASFAAYAGTAACAEVFAPAHASPAKLAQIEIYGATLNRIEGAREKTTDALEAATATGLVYASHAWSPFTLEGTKTVAYELWEQLTGRSAARRRPRGATARRTTSYRRSGKAPYSSARIAASGISQPPGSSVGFPG
jgi:hypothetical protein